MREVDIDMKIEKILTLMLCMVLTVVSGCSKNDNGEFRGVVEDKEIGGWDYILNDYNLAFTFEELGGIDEKLALDIGNAAIKSAWSRADEKVLENTKFIIYEIKDMDVYVICRYYENWMGGDCNVAISKKDGAILKLWGGE